MSNNNIFKEIEANLIKNGDNIYTSLDICIKQKKIFGILFISRIVPTINDIIKILNEVINSLIDQNNDIFKLIICICDEEKSDYDLTLSKFINLSCFIIPFESEAKDKLLDKYNIISLPCLIIFDKDGQNLEYLNNSQICDINTDTIKGWNNIFSIRNTYKAEKYSIGDEGYVSLHIHKLIYTDYLGKSPNYGTGNWYCDICGKSFKYNVENFYCDICGYDLCDVCYEKNKKFS